ncbi:MAG: hypothetical protein ACR2IS_00940 [Nitrososphaeraceae archaeon]
MLNIIDNSLTLQKRVAELTEKSEDNEDILKAKLQERNEELEALKQRQDKLEVWVLEILAQAKSTDGRVVKDRTILDAERKVTFRHLDKNNQLIDVKVPIDSVDILRVEQGEEC